MMVLPRWTLNAGDSLALTLEGPPRTKKNSGAIVQVPTKTGGKRPMILPSKAWRGWLKDVQSQPVTYRLDCGGFDPEHGRRFFLEESPALAQAVNCRATFYRDRRGGDAVGYYQGVADVLESLHLLDNDRRIVTWDGSTLRLANKEVRPCVVVQLTPAMNPDA